MPCDIFHAHVVNFSQTCHDAPVPKCLCDDGYVMQDSECVSVGNCGCNIVEYGKPAYIYVSEVFCDYLTQLICANVLAYHYNRCHAWLPAQKVQMRMRVCVFGGWHRMRGLRHILNHRTWDSVMKCTINSLYKSKGHVHIFIYIYVYIYIYILLSYCSLIHLGCPWIARRICFVIREAKWQRNLLVNLATPMLPVWAIGPRRRVYVMRDSRAMGIAVGVSWYNNNCPDLILSCLPSIRNPIVEIQRS